MLVDCALLTSFEMIVGESMNDLAIGAVTQLEHC